MLKGLFGNRNIERILLFLFVNEQCYGAQLQLLLRVPLTPIQKALLRLEKEGILHSYYEGKTRIYQINPSYPLHLELENLLKKAYTLLPSSEKKRYCFIHKPKKSAAAEGKRERNRREDLTTFWEKISSIKRLTLTRKMKKDRETTIKIGKAAVETILPASGVLIFQEKGVWLHDDFPDTGFNNTFRWTIDMNTCLITLEHLRYGESHPVFLFHLVPTGPHRLESVDAHLCLDDVYLGNIVWSDQGIDFHWRVIGPNKNEELSYQYI